LLDEPLVGLDVVTKNALIDGLLSVDAAAARTIVIASHDLAEMELLVDHVIVLDDGRVRLAGDLDEPRAHGRTAATLRDLYLTHTERSTTSMEPAA
jgi:ABC-2 type transport system ATP-binding protein